MRKTLGLLSLILACALSVWGQRTVPARIIVTVGHYYGPEPPLLKADDLTVTQGGRPLTITSLTPLQGWATLDLFVLVDNCSSCEVGSNFDELRRFIASQLSTTSVGVAYIQDGRLQVAVTPTTDHERAIKALSPPGGSKPSSPYGALADLIESWRHDSSHHVVLMISSGIDPEAAPQSSQSKSAEAAIQAAQRAGVTVYAIYHPSADYATAAYDKLYGGQVLLAQVGEETGGESYFLSFGPLHSLAPFLADISHHLANQYLLEFLANPGNSPEELQDVWIKSKLPDVDLMAPYKFTVSGNSSIASQATKVAPRKAK